MPNNNNDKTQNQNQKIQPQKDQESQKQDREPMSEGIGRAHQGQKDSTDIERKDNARQVGNDNDTDRDVDDDQDEVMPEQGQQKVGSGQTPDRDRK